VSEDCAISCLVFPLQCTSVLTYRHMGGISVLSQIHALYSSSCVIFWTRVSLGACVFGV